MSENKPEFYAARDAVNSGLLHKCSLGTLKKHLAALREHYPWKDDPKCVNAVITTDAQIRAVSEEYERRKAALIKRAITFGEIIAATVIGGLILFFLTNQ